MTVRRLEVEQWLPRPLTEVFPYFSDPRNLDDLTPPWLHFRVLTDVPKEIHAGLLIDYKLRLYKLPVYWRTEITAYEPPHRFVDTQLKGPYRLWVHEHTFTEKDGGVLMRDRVDYRVPGWLAEPLLHRWLVGPDLRTIFDFRRGKLEEVFGSCASSESNEKGPRVAPRA